MKQRIDELEYLHETVCTAIKIRSSSLTDTQRLVAKYEYLLHTASKSLTDLRQNALMKQTDFDLDLISQAAEHRRQLQVRTALFVTVKITKETI